MFSNDRAKTCRACNGRGREIGTTTPCLTCKGAGRLCNVRRAYRGLASIGDPTACMSPVVTPAGFCRRHDPELQPKRDKRGRIIPTASATPAPVPTPARDPIHTCATCGSTEVFARAWVALNDRTRIEPITDGELRAWCDVCKLDVDTVSEPALDFPAILAAITVIERPS